MEAVKLAVSLLALIVAISSFAIAQLVDSRSKKAEDIRTLLGDKESVAFGALKLLRDGPPARSRDRSLVTMAIMQACVFEGSDRARALLYRVKPKHSKNCRGNFLLRLRASGKRL